MSYAHNNLPDVTQTFKNDVLVKNWYEDRIHQTAAEAHGEQHNSCKPPRATKERVLPPTHAPMFETTKQANDKAVMLTPPPKAVKPPSMYSQDNIEERLATYSLADSIHYTIGPNALTEAAKKPLHLTTTTNQHFYEEKPQQAIATHPEQFSQQTAQFAKTNHCQAMMRGERSDVEATVGGKGARGEVTRRPGEAGSVYGVSVFVDEYAKWGTALKGEKLADTAAKMQTKHF